MSSCPQTGRTYGSVEPRRLSVIIPAYNEAGTIRQVLDRVAAVSIGLDKEIVLVDDGSRDHTCAAARQWMAEHPETRARLIRHERNSGKGTAVRTGIREATGELILIQDADLEYQPDDYPKMLAAIERGADAVYGSRLGPGARPRWDSFRQWLANRILTTLTNVLCGATLRDVETCYKLVRAEGIRRLALSAGRFDIEPEITIKLLRAGARIVEVPVSYRGRDARQGKKIRWTDALHAIWAIVKYRVYRR